MLHKRLADDDGVGIVVVLGVTTIIMVLIMTAISMAVNALSMSRHRSDFERSLAAAEAGVDTTLGRLQMAYDTYSADYPVPALATAAFPDPECNAEPVASPADFDTADEEREWAADQITALVAANPDCLVTLESAQYAVLKPATSLVNGRYPGFGRVYAIGWSPFRGAKNESSRMVKAEYVFLPYAPSNAILTSGNLQLDSSTTVSTATGYDPGLAGVHSNGTISTTGNPTVYGVVTSTGTSTATSNRFYSNPTGRVQTAPRASLPRVNVRSFYFSAPNSDAAAMSRWFDLCPDGTVHARSDDGPCLGEVNGSQASIGWEYDSGDREWVAGRNTVSGVFYVHEANVDVGTGNASIPNITVVASSANANDCSTKQYGNIVWDHYDMRAPGFHNLFLMAEGDLATGANFTAGDRGLGGTAVVSGMFVAGDQVSMQTSSQGAVGSIIAADRCNASDSIVESNIVRNPSVYFDPDGDSPFSDIITVTLWLEYAVD